MSIRLRSLSFILSLLAMLYVLGHEIPAQDLYEQNMYPFDNGGLWGYIDDTGQVVIEPMFSGAPYFSEGLAEIGIAGKASVIDVGGNIVFDTDLDFGSIEMFREGNAAIHDQRGWGFINHKGKIFVQP